MNPIIVILLLISAGLFIIVEGMLILQVENLNARLEKLENKNDDKTNT